MSIRRGVLVLVGLCAIIIVLSFAGVISDFLTHLIPNVDGLLLLLISLLMGAIFSVMIYVLAKEAGLWPLRRSQEAAAGISQQAAAATEQKSGQEQTAGMTR